MGGTAASHPKFTIYNASFLISNKMKNGFFATRKDPR